MSNEATSWAVKQDPGGSGPKLLLMILANHAGKDGVCYPGRAILAEECCNRRSATVTDNFKRLESLGLVKRLERRRSNGSRTSDWTILAPCNLDRGAMIDAQEDRPPEVVLVAKGGTENVPEQGNLRYGKRTTSGTENRGARNVRGNVRGNVRH